MTESTITLAGGCFWCTEAVFLRVRGVTHVESGYANGTSPARPSYEEVCTGATGYAEVVRLRYDPAAISLAQLLEIFFATHDPTTLNRQGADVGTQYRSGIYVGTDEERDIALGIIARINESGELNAPVVTEVEPLRHYWPAENYHQNYFAQHPGQGFCAVVIAPKVQKFEKTFSRFRK